MSIKPKKRDICNVCGEETEFYIERFNKIVCNNCCMKILDGMLNLNEQLEAVIFHIIPKKD